MRSRSRQNRFYTFFREGQAIQNDLRERLKSRDKARERAVSNKLHELEQNHVC